LKYLNNIPADARKNLLVSDACHMTNNRETNKTQHSAPVLKEDVEQFSQIV